MIADRRTFGDKKLICINYYMFLFISQIDYFWQQSYTTIKICTKLPLRSTVLKTVHELPSPDSCAIPGEG